MAKIDLENGESKIGKWTLNFTPEEGVRYTGDFHVTNKNVYFESKFDTSLVNAIGKGLSMAAFNRFNGAAAEGLLKIPREEIQTVETKKSFFKKQVILHLQNGVTLPFNYGMLSVDKIAAALQ